MTDVITATVIEAEEVVTATVTVGDNVTVTDNGVEHQVPAGGAYTCTYGEPTPATVIDNGVSHDVNPGEEYTCAFGPAADGEVHNSDHSISIVVPSGGSEEFPDGDLLEFDGTHTPLIAGANAVAKVPVNTIISDTDGNELLNLAPGIPGTAPDGTVTNTLGHTVITVMSGDIKQGADINVHKGDGSTIQHPLGEDYTEDPNEGSLTLGFPVDSVLSMSRTIKADEAGTYIGLTLDNCATLEIQKNTVVQNYPAVPMVLAEGDILLETITRTDPAAESSVKIFY